MLHYTEILQTTYADRDVTLWGDDNAFRFTIRNPEWEGGDITIERKNNALTLSFATMHERFDRDFGGLVAMVDALLLDECMIFELYSHGEDVLGGSRGTDEIDIDHSIPAFLRSLCEGDRAMLAELKEVIGRGACWCRLRGWRRARNRSILLS